MAMTSFIAIQPLELTSIICKGKRAVVPFGNGNKKRVALIMDVVTSEEKLRLKPIVSIIDDNPILTDEMLEMVSYLKRTTLCTYFDALKTIIPSGLGVNILQKYKLTGNEITDTLDTEEQALADFLVLAKSQKEFDALLDTNNNPEKEKVVKGLIKKGVIEQTSDVKRKIQDETVRMLRLSEDYILGTKNFTFQENKRRL